MKTRIAMFATLTTIFVAGSAHAEQQGLQDIVNQIDFCEEKKIEGSLEEKFKTWGDKLGGTWWQDQKFIPTGACDIVPKPDPAKPGGFITQTVQKDCHTISPKFATDHEDSGEFSVGMKVEGTAYGITGSLELSYMWSFKVIISGQTCEVVKLGAPATGKTIYPQYVQLYGKIAVTGARKGDVSLKLNGKIYGFGAGVTRGCARTITRYRVGLGEPIDATCGADCKKDTRTKPDF